MPGVDLAFRQRMTLLAHNMINIFLVFPRLFPSSICCGNDKDVSFDIVSEQKGISPYVFTQVDSYLPTTEILGFSMSLSDIEKNWGEERRR
jgi:hypothetical protein